MTLDLNTQEGLIQARDCCQQYGSDNGGRALLAMTGPFNTGQLACHYWAPGNESNYTGDADSFLDPATICDAVPQESSVKPLNQYLIYILLAVVFVGGLWALKKYKVL